MVEVDLRGFLYICSQYAVAALLGLDGGVDAVAAVRSAFLVFLSIESWFV